jgi:hypothetical protein
MIAMPFYLAQSDCLAADRKGQLGHYTHTNAICYP